MKLISRKFLGKNEDFADTVGKSFTIFWQKFRESNGFDIEITKLVDS